MNKVLNILGSFKYSINIKDDYLNNEKINGFFPTYKTTHRLIKFLNNIKNKNNGASLLSGSYGTGKSFQIAVLLAILTSKKNNLIFDKFVQKVQNEDEELKVIIDSIGAKNYFIVFPDDYFTDFKQSIVMGILDAIKENQLQIDLNTNYNVVKQKILNWEQNYSYIYKMFIQELESKSISIQKYIKKIEEHDLLSYSFFEEIYPKIMGGDRFTPYDSLINITKIISDFEQQICNQGFDGVIYVFDEFGRFLEENILSINVKQIQDIAEYCNAENNSNFILISHKDLFQYSYKLSDEHLRNEWEKVSGRFYKEHLYYEENNVFEMIKKILTKTEFYTEFINNNNNFFDTQRALFDEFSAETELSLIESIYPLNYISFLLLPSLSQKLAQNERTLFSFLCGDEELSLKNVFRNQDKTPHLITPNFLFDYFIPNFKYLDVDSTEYRTYLNSKEILKRVTDDNLKNLIKIISIIFINNDFEKVKPNFTTLNFAFGKKEKLFENSLQTLIQLGYIVHKRHLGYYSLKTDFDVNVDLDVEDYIKNELGDINFIEILENDIPLGYEYPTQYNQDFHITRFFSKHYYNENYENVLVNKNYNDGLIFYYIPFNQSELQEIKLNQYKNSIIIIPLKSVEITKELRILESIKRIASSDKYLTNSSAKQELIKYKLEIIDFIGQKMNNAFNDFYKCKIYFENSLKDINTESEFYLNCNSYLETKFKKYIPVNYELINKNIISSPMKKSRIEILNRINNNDVSKEFFYNTSAESSLARIFLLNSNIYDLEIKKIDFNNPKCLFKNIYAEIVKKIEKKSIEFNQLYNEYTSSNSIYGFRKGIFTFLLALICESKSNQVYISNRGREITILPTIFDNIEQKPENYEIGIIKFSDSENSFLDNFANIFKIHIDTKLLLENKSLAVFNAFRRWLLALPKLVINSEFEDNRNLLQIIRGIAINNSKEFFFRKIPSIYKTSNFEVITKLFESDIRILERKTYEFEKRIEFEIKKILKLSDKPFEDALTDWSISLKNGNALKDYPIHLFDWLIITTEKPIKDKQSFLKFFSEKVQGFNFYNWTSEENFIEFRENLAKIISAENPTLKRKKNNELSTLEELLKTKLKQDIDNIGTSLNTEEILKVLDSLYSEISIK